MASLITLMAGSNTFNNTGAVTATYNLDFNKTLDVSTFDQIDLEFVIGAITGGAPTLTFLTSMQIDTDDINAFTTGNFFASSWQEAAAQIAPGNLGWYTVSLPTSAILLKYLRWQITVPAGKSMTIGPMTGMARRKSF